MQQFRTVRLMAGVALTALMMAQMPGTPTVARAEAATEAIAEEGPAPKFLGFAGAFLAGRTADVDNDTGSAIEFYRKALEFDATNAEVRQRLMVALFIDGQFAEGVDLAKAMKSDPAVAQVAKLALAVDAIGKREYRKAITFTDPETTNPIDRLLNTLLKAWANYGDGKSAEALAAVTSLDGPPWYPVFTRFHAGALAQASGDRAAARQSYLASVTDKESGSAAPDTYIRTVMALATLDARSDNQRQALDALASGEDFSPGYAPLAALRQQIEAGIKPESTVATAQQGAAQALFTLGSALNREGSEETVALYLQFARALDPKDAATLVMLGSIKETLGKQEEAIKIYQAVPTGSPMRRVSELQLGLALADLGRNAEARAHLKSLIDADRKDVRSYLAYGSVLSSDKDYAEMAKTYDQAIAAVGPAPSRGNWNLFFQAGIAYGRLKQWPKAEANFRRALQLFPDQPQVMNYLGYSWIDMNINLEEGMEMIRAAVDLRPNDGYIVDSLGWAHYRLGQYDEAVRELERAIELRPADATINDHLGDAYWQVGRRMEARFQWQRALGNEPEDDARPVIERKLSEGLPETPKPATAGDIKAPAAPPTKASPTSEQKGNLEPRPGEGQDAIRHAGGLSGPAAAVRG